MLVSPKRKLSVVTFVLLAFSQLYADGMKGIVVNAKPTSVTVYADRAQVTRTYSDRLTEGSYTLIFDDLPANVDQNSIQVNGKGLVELIDIKFKKITIKHNTNKKMNSLKLLQQKIEDKIRETDDLITQSKKEKNFVIKITEKLTNTKQKEAKSQLDPQKWVKMVSFYRKKITALDKEKRQAELVRRELNLDLEKNQEDISQLGANPSKSKNQVQLKINIPTTGRISLGVSYVVIGPSWKPQYDLRVSSDSKSMAIVYKAKVRQSSGEDWSSVKLKLSTAKPNISGQRPSLKAWYLNIYTPPKVSTKRLPVADDVTVHAIKSMPYLLGKDKKSKSGKLAEQQPQVAEPTERNEMHRKQAGVDSLGINSVFVIKQLATIKADNNAHQVAIFSKTFKAEMRYSVIPKVAEHAYLKAKVTNNTVFPLLAGPANVFLDSNFVARTQIKSVAPKEEFWTYLGVDNGVKVKYQFVNKFHEKTGVFSKTKRDTYEYLITLKNNKNKSVKIHVWDQIPLAKNEDIKVRLIDPVISKANKQVKVDKLKRIEWYYQPKSGETIKIPFKFSVEHPANKTLTSDKGK